MERRRLRRKRHRRVRSAEEEEEERELADRRIHLSRARVAAKENEVLVVETGLVEDRAAASAVEGLELWWRVISSVSCSPQRTSRLCAHYSTLRTV